MAKNTGWEKVERGWWVSQKYGGVCREDDGLWHAYPLQPDDGNVLICSGKFKTMQEAVNKLESM